MKLPCVALAAVIGSALLPFLAAEDSAKIFLYYPWDSLRHSRITISCDEVPTAEVQPGRFFLIDVRPGQHVLIPGE